MSILDRFGESRGISAAVSANIGMSIGKIWPGAGTQKAASVPTSNPLSFSLQSPIVMLLTLALGIIAVRLPFFDYNVLSADESVYLMIGAGMREGHIPYVDIIDRKPIGIFLIYGLADLLFRDAIIGVRIFGALSTLLGSWILARIGQRFLGLGPVAALLSGLLYATYALLFYGDSGQTPVFFMPLVIAGGGLVLRELRRMRQGRTPSVARLGWAGLALGLSLQIKYSTFFECVLFGGLVLLFAWQYRRILSRHGIAAALGGAGVMMVGGLLPTAIAYAVYVAMGHGEAFWFYNITVNLGRPATDFPTGLILFRALLFMAAVGPLVFLGTRYFIARLKTPEGGSRFACQRWVHVVLATWFIAALIGGLAQQQPYATYFFDTLAPLALMAGATLQSRATSPRSSRTIAWSASVVLGLAVAGYVGLHIQKIRDNGSPYLPAAIAEDIKAQGAQSMYVFNYYGIMYPMTGIALPTRYPLPDHLLRNLEAASFQFDAKAELTRIFDNNPSVLMVLNPMSSRIPADRRAMLEAKLAADYCLWRNYEAGPQHVSVYLHKAAPLPSVSAACQAPADPNEWLTAVRKPGDKRRWVRRPAQKTDPTGQ